MRKYLVNLFYFTCLALIAYPICVFGWGKLLPSVYRKNLRFKETSSGQLDLRLKDADTTRNIDLLILGSSHAYRGYDPRIFKKRGIRVFNLGSSAQTPIQTEVLFNKYLDQFNPKYVIIDVYPALLASNGVESSLDLIANKCLGEQFVTMFLKQKNIMVINSALFTAINTAVTPPKLTRKILGTEDKYVVGGFTESYKKYKAKKTKEKKFDVEISSKQLDALRRIIDKLKENKLRYILVQAPVTNQKYVLINNNQEMDKEIARLGVYYNFNNLLKLNNDHFYDDHHLNQYGVEIFNNRLMELINYTYAKK